MFEPVVVAPLKFNKFFCITVQNGQICKITLIDICRGKVDKVKSEIQCEKFVSKSTDTQVTRVRYTSRQGICYFCGAEVSYLVIAKICLYPV